MLACIKEGEEMNITSSRYIGMRISKISPLEKGDVAAGFSLRNQNSSKIAASRPLSGLRKKGGKV